MKTNDLIEEHIKNVDYNPRDMTTTPFFNEVTTFLDTNKDLKDDELIKKFTEKFTTSVDLRERYTLFKTVKTIKKWVVFFGVVLIIEIITGIIIAGLCFS